MTSSAIFPHYVKINCSLKWMHIIEQIRLIASKWYQMCDLCSQLMNDWYYLPLTISCVMILIERNHAPAFLPAWSPFPKVRCCIGILGNIMLKIVHGWYNTRMDSTFENGLIFILFNKSFFQNAHKNLEILMLGTKHNFRTWNRCILTPWEN